jgi:anti-anti-sigma factor
MRVSAGHDGLFSVVRLAGRLDGEAARNLSDTLEDVLREGARSIELEMAEIEYLSSAGIRVLARFSEDLTALRGSLHVLAPSPQARAVLEAAGLGATIIAQTGLPRASNPSGRFSRWGLPSIDARFGSYEISHYSDDGVRCGLVGPPDSLLGHTADASAHRVISFPRQTFGLGIGALGDRYEDGMPRFGELIAAEGIAAYLPTEGNRVPDFMMTYAKNPPKAVMLQGITWRGMFSDLIRFSTQPDADEIPMAELAEVGVEMLGADAVAIAAVAEMRGVVGASLRHSPSLLSAEEAALTDAAHLREKISFTPEQAHHGTTALILGVAARRPDRLLAPYLRPMDAAGSLSGHFHAAIFPYSPVPQRTVLLSALLERVFQESPLRDVLHLVHDDRGAEGSGQTGLLRGVCWMARIDSTEMLT